MPNRVLGFGKGRSFMTQSGPRNPFYILLLLVSLLFVITALGVYVVLRAEQAGADVPKEGFHQLLKSDGVWWLLYEVAAIAVLSLLSMGLDRLRSLQKQRSAGTIPPELTTETQRSAELHQKQEN